LWPKTSSPIYKAGFITNLKWKYLIMKIITCILCLLMTTGCVMKQQAFETGFIDRSVVVDGVPHKYQIYIPRNYDASQELPAILFLHGGGERGGNGLAQTHVGLGQAIRFNPERWPAITVFPQAPNDAFWTGDTAKIAMAALDETINSHSIDESRVYLTGLSLGGGGVPGI
jgi:predicted peptidase